VRAHAPGRDHPAGHAGADQARAVAPVEGDLVAAIGENRKMLIFPIEQVPEMTRGRGVRLQRHKDGGLSDIRVFEAEKGLTWTDSAGRVRLVFGGWARCRGGGRWSRSSRPGWIDPARLDPPIQAVGGLWSDAAGVQNEATERRLDMAGWTAEAVIEIEMAEGGLEVVAPEQAHHPTAEPDALGRVRRGYGGRCVHLS